MLDDGSHVLFTVTPQGPAVPGEGTIVVQSVQGGERKALVQGGTGAHVLATGRLSTCMAGACSACRSTHGPSKSRALRSCSSRTCPRAAAASSGSPPTGTLVYPSVPPPSPRALVWVDRQGREDTITAASAGYQEPRLSPSGTQLAVSSAADIWIWTFASKALTRLTFTRGAELNPAWIPDGRGVVFDATEESGSRRILRKAADGTGATDVVVPPPGGYPDTVSPDGKFLVYHTASQYPVAMLLPLDHSGPERPLVATKGQTLNAEIAPDGHWIAYQSDETGHFEIYVHPFPDVESGRWQISFTGGSHPLWARHGRELFFIDGEGGLMSTPISSGTSFTHGTPVRLFAAGQYALEFARNYDVSVDATRFLFLKNLTSVTRPSLVVVSRWLDEVRAKIGTTLGWLRNRLPRGARSIRGSTRGPGLVASPGRDVRP